MKSLELVVFLSRGGSLEAWNTSGILQREVALYQALNQQNVRVSVLSYGRSEEQEHTKRFPEINILFNRHYMHPRVYELLAPYVHHKVLRQCDVIKTNQTNGAQIALRAARFWRKPMIVRCGYMWSQFAARQYGDGSSEAVRAARIESKVFNWASRIVVTTSAMHDDIRARMPGADKKTLVIPNYVDTEVFYPTVQPTDKTEVLFVGRFAPQKNVTALLEAIRVVGVTATIVGSGPDESELRQQFSDLQGRVKWLGNIKNSDLPDHMRHTKIFVLPSHYEGHPKVLLEAMACGMALIGADSPGIRELITHGENGWLCAPTARSIAGAIQELLARPELIEALGRNARQFASERFSLRHIARIEAKLLAEVGLN